MNLQPSSSALFVIAKKQKLAYFLIYTDHTDMRLKISWLSMHLSRA